MDINLKDYSGMFRIERRKLKEIPKPKSLLILSMLAKYDRDIDIFLFLAGLRIAKYHKSFRKRSLDRIAIKKCIRLVDRAVPYKTTIKRKAFRR